MDAASNTAEPVVALDDAQRVAGDLWCIGCQYNLHTLEAAGACPECGTPVQRSIHAAERRLDPAWLGRLKQGAIWLAIGALSSAALGVLAWLANEGHLRELELVVPVVGLVVAVVCTLVGLLRVSAPEPNHKRYEPRLSARRMVRWSLLGIPAAIVAMIGVFTLYDALAHTSPGDWLLLLLLVPTGAAAAFTLSHGGQIAQRLGHPWLRWVSAFFSAFVLLWLGVVAAYALRLMRLLLGHVGIWLDDELATGFWIITAGVFVLALVYALVLGRAQARVLGRSTG